MISKRHIFSFNKEQILTKLWAVGSGNPLAAHLLDSGEIPQENERLGEGKWKADKIQVVGESYPDRATQGTILRPQLPLSAQVVGPAASL